MKPSEMPEIWFIIQDEDNVVYDAATFFDVREILERCRKENPDKVISAVCGYGAFQERIPL